MPTILVVEDNDDINELLKTILVSHYQVIQAYSGTEGLAYFHNQAPDLVLLDIMLPGKDGGQVLAEIRQSSNIPVIMLTAISDKKTVTQYLLNGADDYISKPFDEAEVLARIQVCLRNRQAPVQSQLSFCDLELDEETYQLLCGGQAVQLRLKEYDILKLLFNHPQQVFTKEQLYASVWGQDYLPGDNNLNTHLSNIRKKIKKISPNHDYIETMWGLGIRLKGKE